MLRKKTTELGKDKVKMKKAMVFLAALLVFCGISLAEDAVTSATLSVDRLPAVESTGSSILVVYFSTDDTIRAAAPRGGVYSRGGPVRGPV